MNYTENSLKSFSNSALLIFITAIIFRIILIFDQYVTIDDLYTITITRQQSFIDAWVHKIVTEPHPPLYNCIAYFWSAIFTDSILSLHALSAIFIFVALLLIYRDGRHILPKYVHLSYLALAALAPISLNRFLEIRPYSLYFPASMLAMLYFIALAKEKKGDSSGYAASYALSACVTCLSHYFGMALVFFQVFYLFILSCTRKEKLFNKKHLGIIFPILCSLVWFFFHVTRIKNNQIATTWIYPTGIKYVVGYFGQIFGMPIARIGSSNDPQSLQSILKSPLETANVIAVCIPIVALLFLFIFNNRAIRVQGTKEEKSLLLAAAYMSLVPFVVFFIIGKIVPVVNWKYMMGYIPCVWILISLLLCRPSVDAYTGKFFISSIVLSSFFYIPGLLFIPRDQIGDALKNSTLLSEELHIPLVLPNIIEYKYFINNDSPDGIIWKDIEKEYRALPDNFITVFGNCTPTTALETFSCVKAGNPILMDYDIKYVWKFAKAGIYQFTRKQ